MSKTAITLVVLMTIFGGACAIGIVWLRMDISDVAAKCGVLEDEREVLSREVQELRGQRSWALRPSTLASMVEGRLAMPGPRQTYHVSETDMVKRLGGYRRTDVVAVNNGDRGKFSDRMR
ncbi:MAG: hypothetical protein CMI19_05395 [Opitutae bacterium]|jgi:hypothetical protein|nr:hypothetical protein [Opitutae bacterium]|tara:strand:+ start:134 stop:493 length:360 start_codon:yes stop_codon:yes gene_type:complete